jgi:hypothetical protein
MPKRNYTKQQKRFIKTRYLKMTDDNLAAEFNVRFGTDLSSESVRRYRSRVGWLKDNRQRLNYPGYVNPCKGRKLNFTPKTAFKKGVMHFNAQHYQIGDIHKDKSDTAYKIKVRWPNVWEYVHINEWLCHGRIIPENHIIMYKNGDKENWSIDNLVCVHEGVSAIINRHCQHIDDHEIKILTAQLMLEQNEALREAGLDPQTVRYKLRNILTNNKTEVDYDN